jgi:hypothetical protein
MSTSSTQFYNPCKIKDLTTEDLNEFTTTTSPPTDVKKLIQMAARPTAADMIYLAKLDAAGKNSSNSGAYSQTFNCNVSDLVKSYVKDKLKLGIQEEVSNEDAVLAVCGSKMYVSSETVKKICEQAASP